MTASPSPPLADADASGQEQLALYRAMANVLPVAVVITDAQGQPREVNPKAESLLGPAVAALCSGAPMPPPWQLLRPDGSPLPPEAAPGALVLASGEHCPPQELGLRRPDGSLARLLVSATPLYLAGHGVALVAQDETVHLQALDALQARDRHYRMAVTSGRLGGWEWDATANTLHLDPILKQMLGFSNEELPSAPAAWIDRIHPEDRPRLLQKARECLQGARDSFEDEHRMLHKDGRELWFFTRGTPTRDEAGRPLTLGGTHVDVTHLKQVRDAAAQVEHRARLITEHLPLGLAVINAEERIILANPRLRDWYSHVDFDASPSCCVLLPDHCQTCPPGTCPCVPRPDAAQPGELQQELALPGGVRTLRFSFCAIQLEDAARREVLALVEDVTAKTAVEAQLQRAQKLEAMGTLAAGIAHEINQPLNALQLYGSGLEMLLENNPALPVRTIRERVRLMLQEANKVTSIINHMRALSRLDTPAAIQPVDVGAVVRSALLLLRAQLAAHGIELHVVLAPDIPAALASPMQLEQAVINLVVNAMQALDTLPANPERPKYIRVETSVAGSALGQSSDPFTNQPPGQSSDHGGHVLLCVEDNGPGLGGSKDRLFDPFFTTKDANMCMGLGLSIVHSLTRAWGADIFAETTPAQGARFTLRLRAATEQ